MTTFNPSQSFSAPGGLPGAVSRFAAEATAFMQALMSPGALIAQVEQMHALQVEAGRVEASDPARAAALRQRAARLCR